MPRTTLTLEEEAIRTAWEHARRHGLTFGQAVSDLVKRGAEPSLVTEERTGLRVVHLRRGSQKVTAELVERLRDQLP